MAYQGGNRSGYQGKAAAATASIAGGSGKAKKIETERVYNVAFRVGEGEFIGLGTVDKYPDSGNLTMSLNKEALDSLPVTESGWINKVRLYIPKDQQKK